MVSEKFNKSFSKGNNEKEICKRNVIKNSDIIEMFEDIDKNFFNSFPIILDKMGYKNLQNYLEINKSSKSVTKFKKSIQKSFKRTNYKFRILNLLINRPGKSIFTIESNKKLNEKKIAKFLNEKNKEVTRIIKKMNEEIIKEEKSIKRSRKDWDDASTLVNLKNPKQSNIEIVEDNIIFENSNISNEDILNIIKESNNDIDKILFKILDKIKCEKINECIYNNNDYVIAKYSKNISKICKELKINYNDLKLKYLGEKNKKNIIENF